jgi:archaellum component FlaG (FlaF/FlaG flagellin family)
MKRDKIRALMMLCVCGMLVGTVVPVANIVSGDASTGMVNNVAPTFTGGSTVAMTVNPTTVDNSGTDTIEFDATFYDANGDTDTEIVQATCTLKVFEGADNSGTLKITWTGVWDSAPGGTEFVLDPTGTAGDGYAFIADTAAGVDPGFVWTVPNTLSGSAAGVQHYVELIIYDDDTATVTTGANFDVTSAIQITGIYANDGTSVDTSSPYDWNFPASDPGSTDVSSGDGTDTYWLVVQNTGSDPTDSFALTFLSDVFTSATTSETIDIDGAIDFEYYEATVAPGGAEDPDDVGGTTIVTDDSDGIWNNADFTALNYYIWIRYEVDIPIVIGDANDYTVSFSVAED